MMLGLGLVFIHKGNMTVNGLVLPQGESLFQNGTMSCLASCLLADY